MLGSLTGVQAVFAQGNLSGAQIAFDGANAASSIAQAMETGGNRMHGAAAQIRVGNALQEAHLR